MRIKIGVMGSAAPESSRLETGSTLVEKAERLAKATAHDAGSFHVGISPGSNEREHVDLYKLPLDACDALIYTGFGLKGRNVVLVRSCDVVLFVAGAMGSLNEFTIAHDEGKIIGCLTGTGGVANDSEYLVQKFGKRATTARVFRNDDPDRLINDCLASLK